MDVHWLLQLLPEPAGLRSRQQSTTEHFTKCGGEGLGLALGGHGQSWPKPSPLYPLGNVSLASKRPLQSPTKRSESLLTK